MRYMIPILRDNANTYITDDHVVILEKNKESSDRFNLYLELPNMEKDIPLITFRKAVAVVSKSTDITIGVTDTISVFKTQLGSLRVSIKTDTDKAREIALPIEATLIAIDAMLEEDE